MKNKPVHEKVTPQTDLDYISEKFHVSTEELHNRGRVVAKVRDHPLFQLFSFFSDSFFSWKEFLLDIQQNHCKSDCCKTCYL